MKRTLILTQDSCNYYYIILENGKEVKRGEIEWGDYEDDTDVLIKDLQKENSVFDFIYWI